MASTADPSAQTRCPFCDEARIVTHAHESAFVVAGVHFVGRAPGQRCEACGESWLHGEGVERLERAAAVALIAAGYRSGTVVRFARKTLGLTARALGKLLDVAPETLSRWENDEREVDPYVLALLAGVLRDRLAGRDETITTLAALRRDPPTAGAKEIRLELGG